MLYSSKYQQKSSTLCSRSSDSKFTGVILSRRSTEDRKGLCDCDHSKSKIFEFPWHPRISSFIVCCYCSATCGWKNGTLGTENPIPVLYESICSIEANPLLADELKRTKLIVWNKIVRTHQHSFEADDRTLKGPLLSALLFSGIMTLFIGDFRQI